MVLMLGVANVVDMFSEAASAARSLTNHVGGTVPSESTYGPYHALYQATGMLWPDRPGRMVIRAVAHTSPDRALDLGCGDGKNAAYLAASGWDVDAVDVSPAAIRGATVRLAGATSRRTRLLCADALSIDAPSDAYRLVVAYGLCHCLNDEQLQRTQALVRKTLKPGGLLAVAVFNDELPVPADHGTGQLFLRPREHILSLFPDWEIVATEFGVIRESHARVIGEHSHAMTWALFKKRDSE